MAMNAMSMAMTFSARWKPSPAPRQMASMELAVVRGTVAEAEQATFEADIRADDRSTIDIETDPITLSNGGAITTNSASGAAGDITLVFDKGGVLILEWATSDGKITTTSATATAGKITIIGPSAIVLNGGQIQALGPFKGAFVTIQSGAIVESSDRLNGLDVAGTLVLDSTVEDVSQAVTLSDASFIDASKVLRGRCAAQAASGETSTLVATPTGPYRNPSATSRPSDAVAQLNTTVSACGPAPGPN